MIQINPLRPLAPPLTLHDGFDIRSEHNSVTRGNSEFATGLMGMGMEIVLWK